MPDRVKKSNEYCQECAERLLGTWRGWPHRSVVPLLPLMQGGPCPACGGDLVLRSSDIAWLNVHGSYSTGLPDHWVLAVRADSFSWGKPYYAESLCGMCGGRSVISHFTHDRHAFVNNCEACGISPVRLKDSDPE